MKNPFSVVKKWFAAGYDAATNSPHQPNLPYSRRVDKDEESLLGKWDRTASDGLVSGPVEGVAGLVQSAN